MKTSQKAGWVVAGYLAALVLACAVVAMEVAFTRGPDRQASSGMAAFGDTLLGLGVFGVASLAPTGMALCFLRPYRKFWWGLAIVALGVGVTGLAAPVLFALGRNLPTTSPLASSGMIAILRMLAAPVLVLAFLLCAALAPERGSRRALLAAVMVEVVVCACGGVVWGSLLLMNHGHG